MYTHIKNNFHLSQKTVHPDATHPRHHRPLTLLMILCILCQQFGMFDTFAASVSETTMKYVYIQTNPTIDDSWIGTPVSKKTPTTSHKSLKPVSSVTSTQNQSQNTDTLVSDGSWILPGKVKKPAINTGEVLNSAPTQEISYSNNANIITNGILPLPANYVTPNGTSYYAIPGNTGPQSSSTSGDANIGGNTNVGGSVSVAGNLSTSGSITSTSLTTAGITLTSGTGTPSAILGRDGSGQVNTVTLGSGLTLTDGRLTVDASTTTLSTSGTITGGSIVSSGSVSGSTGSFGEIMSGTGTFSNIVLSSASTIKNLLCDITGNFFCDGGNTLGKDLTLGTNDAYDQIFETNNLERMRISSGGLVGIGTMTPTEKLSISGNTRTTGYFQSNLGKFIGNEINDYIFLNSQTDDSFRIFLNDTERFTILSNGNVGIGNASPTDKLTINYGYLAINDGGLKFDTEGSGLYTNTLDEEKLNFMKTLYTDGSAGYKWSWRNDDGSQRLDVLSFNKDGSAYFGGNLGVGMKPDPLARLSVSGKLSIRDGSQGTGKILTSDGNGLATWSSLTGGLFSGFTSGRLTFGTASGGLTQSNNLFWDNINGRLGIGTMTPNSALNIVGDMEVTGKILNHGFDFVLGDGDQVSRGDSGYSRALVKNSGNRLSLNFNGDFAGGTTMGALFSQASGTGNIGIGTQNPGEKLEVIGNMKVSGGYLFGNNSYMGGDNGGNIELGGNNLTAGVGTPYIDFHYSGVTSDYNARIINSSSGRLDLIANTLYTNTKLGIGASAPTDALQVVGASRVGAADSYLRTYFDGSNLRIDNTGTGNIVMNYLNGKSVDIKNLLTTYLSVGGDINQRDANGDGFIMHSRGGNGYDFWQLAPSNSGTYDWSKGITLNRASGNVGIGNNAPNEKFSVFGNASFSNYTGGIIIYPGEFPSIAARNGANTVIGQMIFDTTYKKTLIDFDGAGGGDFSIRKVLNSNADTVFRITSGGNVGIGTTTPSATLSVSGSFLLANGTQGIGKILTSDASGFATWSSLTGGLLSGLIPGQLTFGSASGGLTQSGGLFWDNVNGRLGIGTTTPQAGFHFVSTSTIPGFRISGRAMDNSNDANGGVVFGMMHNDSTGNRQMVFGRSEDIGSATNGFVRFIGGANPSLDAISGDGLSRKKIQIGILGDVNSGVFSANLGVYGKIGIGSTYYNSATLPTDGLAVQGNVGIGTTTPNSKLEVNSGTGGLSGLRFTQLLSSSPSSSQYSGILGVNSSGDVGIAQFTGNSLTGFSGGQLTFGNASGGLTQSSGLFWSSTNNRLGIGTSSPIKGLHVQQGGTSLLTSAFGDGLLFSTSNSAGARIFLENLNGGTGSKSVSLVNEQNRVYFGALSDNGGAWINQNMLVMDLITQNVGIGTQTPSYKLHVNGTAAGTSWTNTSDERFKQNISNLTSGLDIIKSLRSVSYNWNALGKAHGGDIDKLQYGFVAQEVENILPAIVNTDSEGYKSIDYIKIIPFLTKALQELAQNTASTGALSTLSGQVASLAVDMTSLSGQVALLSQSTGSTVVNNYYSSGTTTSVSSSSWVDTAFAFASSLLVRVEATFSEMVTFMKSVVFRSTVIFEDRVTYSDKDMAGTAVIQAGGTSVRVAFARAYADTPRVVVTADTFSTYRVTEKSPTGFTIQVREAAGETIAFDWMAIVVRGARTISPENTAPVPAPPSTATGSEDTPVTPEEGTTGSGEIVLPPISEEVSVTSGSLTPETPITETIPPTATVDTIVPEITEEVPVPTPEPTPVDTSSAPNTEVTP